MKYYLHLQGTSRGKIDSIKDRFVEITHHLPLNAIGGPIISIENRLPNISDNYSHPIIIESLIITAHPITHLNWIIQPEIIQLERNLMRFLF